MKTKNFLKAVLIGGAILFVGYPCIDGTIRNINDTRLFESEAKREIREQRLQTLRNYRTIAIQHHVGEDGVLQNNELVNLLEKIDPNFKSSLLENETYTIVPIDPISRDNNPVTPSYVNKIYKDGIPNEIKISSIPGGGCEGRRTVIYVPANKLEDYIKTLDIE